MHHNLAGRWPLVLFGVILIGCAGGAGPRGARSRGMLPATTQSSTAPRTLRFADAALPVDHYRDDDHDVDLRNVIHVDEKNSAADIYFGQCERTNADGDTTETFPLIVASVNGKKGGWRALSLADPRLANAEWQFVAAGPGEREIWGVLDDTLTDKGKLVLLVHSTDVGATWTITQVSKPFEAGEYDSFAMDASGRGRLTVYIAPTRNHPRRAGFYHFRTSDGGKTWSPPEHEADNLDPADDVPDDEDPEPLKSIPTQTADGTGLHPLARIAFGGSDTPVRLAPLHFSGSDTPVRLGPLHFGGSDTPVRLGRMYSSARSTRGLEHRLRLDEYIEPRRTRVSDPANALSDPPGLQANAAPRGVER